MCTVVGCVCSESCKVREGVRGKLRAVNLAVRWIYSSISISFTAYESCRCYGGHWAYRLQGIGPSCRQVLG